MKRTKKFRFEAKPKHGLQRVLASLGKRHVQDCVAYSARVVSALTGALRYAKHIEEIEERLLRSDLLHDTQDEEHDLAILQKGLTHLEAALREFTLLKERKLDVGIEIEELVDTLYRTPDQKTNDTVVVDPIALEKAYIKVEGSIKKD